MGLRWRERQRNVMELERNLFGCKDLHICNGDHECVEYFNWSDQLQTMKHTDRGSQKFNFVDSPDHPGFYFIKNEQGKCVSVKGNTNQTGAEILTSDCKSSETGQRWKWHH